MPGSSRVSDRVAERLDQVRLAQSHVAVQEQRVVGRPRRLRRAERRRVREAVARTDDVVLEGVLGVQPDVAAAHEAALREVAQQASAVGDAGRFVGRGDRRLATVEGRRGLRATRAVGVARGQVRRVATVGGEFGGVRFDHRVGAVARRVDVRALHGQLGVDVELDTARSAEAGADRVFDRPLVVRLQPVAAEGVLHRDADRVVLHAVQGRAAEPGLELLRLNALANRGLNRLPDLVVRTHGERAFLSRVVGLLRELRVLRGVRGRVDPRGLVGRLRGTARCRGRRVVGGLGRNASEQGVWILRLRLSHAARFPSRCGRVRWSPSPSPGVSRFDARAARGR